MDQQELFLKLGISLLLGMLVGLQREHAANDRPGIRTFPLFTLLGTVTALLALELGGWIVAAGLLGVAAVLLLERLVLLKGETSDAGTTTDAAVLLMYAVGALLVVLPREQMGVAIAIGGGVAVLLQFKLQLHDFSNKLGGDDLKAIMQFVLITCIILPVLPNQTYGPLNVFDPRETWLMVVLIVGMSLGGYIAYKFLGRDAGILLGGVLGGAISSTATTVSYSRQAKTDPAGAATAAIVIMIASTVVFVRVLAEMAVVSREFFYRAGPPVVVLMLMVMAPSLILWYRVRKQPSHMPEQENPTQLKSALMFGGMYALVLFALAAVAEYFEGSAGLYVVAALSGLTDMDAITLSTARMSTTDPEILANGWRMIVVGALANLVFKAGMIGLMAGRRLLLRIVLLFAFPMVGGVALLWLWP